MNRLLVVFGLLIAVAAPGIAWQWPTKTVSVSVAFGQSSGGAYSQGVELTGGVQPVYPVANGTVIYVRGPREDSPRQLGTTVVVEHDRGFLSLYGHLEEGTTPAAGTVVTESTQIGVVGQTGAAGGPTLFFSILDTESGAYVNPLLLLPVVEDVVAPTVISVLAQSETSLHNLGVGSKLPTGEYRLLVESEDRWTDAGDLVTPYSVVVLVDGREQMVITHDRIVFTDGFPRVQPGPPVPHDGLHSGERGYLTDQITVPIGRTLIEVIVSDFSGNSASVMIEVIGTP
ncbi:MAG: M23 family metallopeptidase [Spirochaetia bacterium]